MNAAAPIWPLPSQDLALAAPASAFERQALEQGLQVLGGLIGKRRLRLDAAVFAKDAYLAGTDQERAAHLAKLFNDPRVGAVLAVRGGFGCSRLLPLLDLKALAATRKLFMGFSDLSCLLNCLAASGLVVVHGPVITQLPRLDEESLADLTGLLNAKPPWPATLHGEPLSPGRAKGPLFGGNLTLLCHLLGTPYLPPLEGALLFLEDISEAPYRVDRLLTQLELAGVPGLLAGVALGSLDENQAALEAARRRLAAWGKPVLTGLPFGHGSQNRCLPMGALAELDAGQGTLKVGLNLA